MVSCCCVHDIPEQWEREERRRRIMFNKQRQCDDVETGNKTLGKICCWLCPPPERDTLKMIMCVWTDETGGWMVDTCSESEREESDEGIKKFGVTDGNRIRAIMGVWMELMADEGEEGGRGREVISRAATESWELLSGTIIKAIGSGRRRRRRRRRKEQLIKHRNEFFFFASCSPCHASNICEAQKNTKTVRESRPEKNHHETSQKEDKTRNGAKKSKKQEEGKPKKFQFIQNSLNKYNIRYGVFMYIIHFQRNAHSINGLWCEKSLWGFKAPHGAHFIDCTMFPNGSSVRANKWEPKKIAQNRAKKKKNKKSSKSGGKINSSTVRILLKANRKKLYIQTYRCVYISFSAWALNDVIAGIRVNPKSHPSPRSPACPRRGRRRHDDGSEKDGEKLEN